MEERLERFLTGRIPLTGEMGVEVVEANDGLVRIRAPLSANENHHGTLFGGSASALAIVAGWSWIHLRLEEAGEDPDLVIQRSTMEYPNPGRHAVVEAVCEGVAESEWLRFLSTYRRFGRARLRISSVVWSGDVVVGRMKAAFVVWVPEEDPVGRGT